jgi:hypothetical protein
MFGHVEPEQSWAQQVSPRILLHKQLINTGLTGTLENNANKERTSSESLTDNAFRNKRHSMLSRSVGR